MSGKPLPAKPAALPATASSPSGCPPDRIAAAGRSDDAAHGSRHAALALLFGLITLAGCNPMNTQTPQVPVPPEELVGAKAELVDEARRIHRFSGGVCRALADIPAPWKVSTDPGIEVAVSPWTLSLEAPNAAFDFPPPGLRISGGRRSGRGQELIDLTLSAPSFDDGKENALRDALSNSETWGQAKNSPVPISNGFTVRTSNGGNMILVNQRMQAAVWCTEGGESHMPNPRCEGFVFLNSSEIARFFISFEGLSRLTEVVGSVTELAASIRVECPQGVSGDE